MRKSRWNEEEIQSLLKQMPQVKDRRSKEAIYRHIEFTSTSKQRSTRIVPTVVSLAAACLFVVISVSLYSSSPTNESSKEQQPKMSITMKAKESAPEQNRTLQADQAAAVSSRVIMSGKAVVFGLPDKSAQTIIPISFVANEQIARDKQIEAAKSQLAEWGLDSRWFDGVGLSAAVDHPDVWIVRLPKTHPVFSSGSTGETMFLASVEETVRWLGGTSVQFFTDTKKGIDLPNTGHLEAMTISPKKRAYYFYQLDHSYPLFLAPSLQEFATIEEALYSMQHVTGDLFRPSIAKEVHIASVQKQNDGLVVQFAADSSFSDPAISQWMLEAILLTAKEFRFRSVTFTGGSVDHIGPYRFNEKIEVPVAPNPVPAH